MTATRRTSVFPIWCFALLFWVPALCPEPCRAGSLTKKPWFSNDMQRTGNTSFAVAGADPYVFSPPMEIPLRKIAGLLLKLDVEGTSKSPALQMFLGLDDLGWSEYLSFRFTLPPDGTAWLPFPFRKAPSETLPPGALLRDVRLDLENCADCRLHIAEARWMDRSSPELEGHIPPDLRYPIIPRPAASDVSRKGRWRAHGIEALSESRYRLGTDDPYLISPVLDVPLLRTKGVHLHIRFPEEARKRMMQLFWNTYSTGFQERHSIRFLADLKGGVADVYVPLPEFRRNDLLKSIRLDIYGKAGEELALLGARIVDSETEALRGRIPKHMMVAPGSGGNPPTVLADSFRRLTIDKLFITGYVLLLLLIVLAMGWLWKMEE